jgi:Fe-S-cluster formation regulator IscX/YfhJ
MTTKRIDLNLNLILMREGDSWVAQCLEHDLAAQGKTINETLKRWLCTACAHLDEDNKRGNEPFSGLDAAPAYYWTLWNDSRRYGEQLVVRIPEPDVDVDIPPAYMIGERLAQMRLAG